MAITVEEAWGSPSDWKNDVRKKGFGSITHTYIISGTSNENDARQALENVIPGTSKGYPIRDFTISKRLAEEYWEGESNYGKDDGNSEDEQSRPSSYQFEVSGSQQKLLRGIRTLGRYAAPGEETPNFGGLINARKDGVDGIDVDLPTGSFSENHIFRRNVVPANYRKHITYAYGKVNEYPFRGYQAGEVRFLGASDSFTEGDEFYDITYRFAVSENATDLHVGDIGPITKPGWAHLWVYYKDTVDSNQNQLIKKPVGVYVEQVFNTIDFSILRIGQ